MEHVMTNRVPEIIGSTAIIATLVAALPGAAAGDVQPPQVPANLEVEEGHRPFLMAHASGTQNYMCLPQGTAFAWVHQGPQATLFDEETGQVATHFLSENPVEGGERRAAWQHSRDTSTVWAVAIQSSIDPNYVAPGAVAWLKLRVTGAQYGPAGGDRLTRTTFIQRVNTSGGVAPSSGCAGAGDVGTRVFVPYTTDYVFYRARH
jgi:hypothetical protein